MQKAGFYVNCGNIYKSTTACYVEYLQVTTGHLIWVIIVTTINTAVTQVLYLSNHVTEAIGGVSLYVAMINKNNWLQKGGVHG